MSWRVRGRAGAAAAAGLWLAVFGWSSGCDEAGGSSPCADIDCSQRGFCLASAGTAYCACLPDYHPVGPTCVANDPTAPCAGIDCSGHGSCGVVGTAPRCTCEPGYGHLGGNLLLCVPVELACDNGLDDDRDGLVDCTDVDCRSAPACGGGGAEVCDNGADDDVDGFTDCDDYDCRTAPACGGGGEAVCDNGVDDDGDGFVDCEDADCAGSAACS
jgi:hypothetical protein